jgi:lipid-A-disaccharide synthase
MSRELRIAVIAGEESGDQLAADAVAALQRHADVELTGVGGHHLQALGLKSLFDPAEIALVGISAVVRDLPRILSRIQATAKEIIAAGPHCLLTVDIPDFSLRVARKVRASAPGIPIIHYVCPSVWAWRPGRAPAMKPYVDHILCILPFEPDALCTLGGPPGTFVGHRLTSDERLNRAAEAQALRAPLPDAPRSLLVLPGSRRGEVKRLLEPFGQTVDVLRERGNAVSVDIPTVPHVRSMVEELTRGWKERPRIVTDPDEKWAAIAQADAAICASGTVTLELALAGVPMLSCYRLDPLARALTFMLTAWSASLPNLIADRPVVPEFYNEAVRPNHLAHWLEPLLSNTELRRWQLSGFAEIRSRLTLQAPAGELAARAILEHIERTGRA